MASLQAKHSRRCALGPRWTSFDEAVVGCTCPDGPAYFIVVREGHSASREWVGRDRRHAEAALHELAGSASNGHGYPPNTRFADWADRWLASLERKPSTINSYRSTVVHAKEAFGDRLVRLIGPEDVGRLNLTLRERGHSASTRAKHLRVLSACLQAAVFYRYADSNPVRELPPAQRPRPDRKEAAYFENAELPLLFAQLQDEPYRSLCLTALKTGMRQGELLALRWCDVDLDEAVARVRRSYTGGAVGTPKNRERRDVDLITDVVELLGKRRSKGWSGSNEDLIFYVSSPQSFLTTASLLRRQLYPAMARAGIQRAGPTQELRTFHSFRHTFAKRALESGAEITWLSRHLGHSTLKVTTDIYGHWERAERKLQAAKMEGAFPV
jgi:integrase